MDLLTPEAQDGAHYWASVLLAHAFIGLFLTAVLAAILDALDAFATAIDRATEGWTDGTGWLACGIVIACYGLGWEVAVQRVGAGWTDAAVDTVAVACGALAGVAAWARRGVALAASLVVLAGVAAAGVWNRTGKRGGDEG